MVEFFSHAPANLRAGTSSDIMELLETHRQQRFSGLVEIDFEKGRWINILLLSGEVVGNYYLTASTSNSLPVSDLEKWWSGESANIRTLALPGGAIRIISMACEWHPAAQSLLVQSSGLQNILQVFLVNKISGLLHVIDSTGELAFPILDGFCVNAEAVYCTAQIETGSSALSRGMHSTSRNCSVELYEARPDTVSFKQLVLRQVVSELAGSVLARYSQIVGGSLLGAMDFELNQVLQLNQLQMRLVGERLDNSHIFRSLEEATRSYSTLFKALHMHMTHVIGDGLAGILQKEAYRSLNPRNQAAIDKQLILSDVQW